MRTGLIVVATALLLNGGYLAARSIGSSENAVDKGVDDIALAKKLRAQAIEHLVADEYGDAALLLSQALSLNAHDGDTLRLFEMAKEGQVKQAARRQEKLVK